MVALSTQYTVGLLQASEGEKDPRNLMTVFTMLAAILDTLDPGHLQEELFEALAVYFPVDFSPPRGVPNPVTRAELVEALRRGLSHPALASARCN